MEVRKKTGLVALCVGALGVVYGDIGTSPLYTLKQTFFGTHHLDRTLPNVLGALSLVFWTLTLIVCVKYVLLVLRADLNGEGGVFALLGIIRNRQEPKGKPTRKLWIITTAVMVGAACLYGEGVITPVISVLSAYEGLGVATPALKKAVVPITFATLFLLFWFQSRGTGRVGKAFGPIMVAWFATIGVAGLVWIVRYPQVLEAVNPVHAAAFLTRMGMRSLFVLGAVVLAITGVEALFADLGHFGSRAIRVSWFSLVYPALLLNYFGQGARLLDPAPVPNHHLFYALFPQNELLYAVIALATLAAVIASQAVISGAFSLTRQAIALGFFPRLRIIFTSAEIQGRIYMPMVNWLLFAGCAVLTLVFGTSNGLAAAYGVAVTGTMAITSFIFYFVARGWGWRWYLVGPVCAVFLVVDLSFFGANTLKIANGGFVPILIAAALFGVMKTWQWGRGVLARAYLDFARIPMHHYIELKQALMESPNLRIKYGRREVAQVERAVVFLSSRAICAPEDPCPIGLRVYIRRNGAMPKHVILLNVLQMNRPSVPASERYKVIPLGANIVSVNAQYGYMQTPHVPTLLKSLKRAGLIKINESRWTVQVGEEEIIIDKSLSLMRRQMLRFFIVILRLSNPADRYFGMREHAGRNKTVIPVVIGADFSRIAIVDEEPIEEAIRASQDPGPLPTAGAPA
ncbi:MAG: KUP/HAK/KT family potassium transporter [Deltaproteobacteria bacterium]|nr:KUP/HAK/KT family potassium transporter [Deltaproteobacteria bacterium]